jgi:hypothetical protein
VTSFTSRLVASARCRALFATSPKPPYFSGPKTRNGRYAPAGDQFQTGTFLPDISRTDRRIGRWSGLAWVYEPINSIQEITKEKAYIGDHGCWANCRGYIITSRHARNAFAKYKSTVIIGEGLESGRHKFGYVKPLPTDVN